jgi:adenosylcobinamide-phosphate synthase
MIVSFGAFLIDCAIGDPRSKFHPVVLIGKLIAFLEGIFYRQADTAAKKLFAGGMVVCLVLSISYMTADALLTLTASFAAPWLENVVAALLLSFMISPRNLAEAGREIKNFLLDGNLAEARHKVGWIVGRDTDQLSVGDVTRATVETISENIVDGVISPLFFFWLGGVPLAVAYRAANTMDSMLGYRNEKYLYFGRVAARLDDVLNFVPARITGLMLVAAAWLLKLDYRNAWRMMRRDALKHPSPNGGYTEATVAGALGIRLGGLNYYFGQPSFRTYMGEPLHALGPQHIQQAIRLMYLVTVMFLLLLAVGGWIGGQLL